MSENSSCVLGSKPPGAAAVASPAASDPIARIDLAHVLGDRLFVHGWIFGLSTQVARAEVGYRGEVHDLLSRAVRVPRPDVTRHFSADPSTTGDDHGFHLTVPLTDSTQAGNSLRLGVALHSGAFAESLWTVGRGEAGVIAFFQQNPATLNWLLMHLERRDAERLRKIMLPALPDSALPIQFGVDLCCILERRFLLTLGWCIGVEEESTIVEATLGSTVLDFLARRSLMPRPDIEPRDGGRGLGFVLLTELAAVDAAADHIDFDFYMDIGHARTRCPIVGDPREARASLAALLSKLDSDAAIELIESICERLGDSPNERSLRELLCVEHCRAVERLPISLENVTPRYFLHVDLAVSIPGEGIFLDGWFGSDTGAYRKIACHTGFTGVRIEGDWVRHPRADVVAHLATKGMLAAGSDHGFACYVRLEASHTPYFIAVTSSDGTVRRMRMPVSSATAAPLQTVRALLTSFNVEHRALGALLDRQVGPAVQAAWARRRKPETPVTVQRFGEQPSSPQISVIVPLYGRSDFAEYQLALFADDPDFQELELIYFVDDPTIYDPFRLKCGDLQKIYGVPFTLMFAGSNLGFAGANNCAAELARGSHLLLMNSDVFPKVSGWAGAMLRVYGTLQHPGLLGVKLLYEDGSVQHAGMSFRQHAPWSDLWINYHPHKGLSPLGLRGVREVDAVTAACVMIDRSVYLALGGLCEDYIIGDFEDSDLCLRAAAAGRRNRVALDIELYHLERQSQDRSGDSRWRTNLTVYNCWQHHKRWAGLIERRAS